jgi:hypothetical protein
MLPETNETIDLREILLSNLLTSRQTEILILTLIVPLGAIGSLFNLISTLVLSRPLFKKLALFKYLRVYSLTSLFVTFLMFFFFYMAPNLLFDLALSYIGRFFKCFVANNLITLLFSFGNVLDILFNLERASYFNKKFESFKRISPYYACLGSLFVCGILHIPNFLIFRIAPTDLIYVERQLCIYTPFSSSAVGRVLLLTSFILEGPVVLLLVIITNIIAYISYKSFLKRKSTLNQQQTSQLASSALPIISSEQKKRKEKKERNQETLVQMTLWISTFSVLIHIIQFSSQFVLFILQRTIKPEISAWFLFLYSFIIVLKHFSSIFFLYKFNNNFRKSIYICCSSEGTARSSANTDTNRQPMQQI